MHLEDVMNDDVVVVADRHLEYMMMMAVVAAAADHVLNALVLWLVDDVLEL